ncbi:MAG: hypothetical protein P1V35_05790 [Planctomycetota bacterium]|nr:hypothetical protein [Planctomycetota bacterium]
MLLFGASPAPAATPHAPPSLATALIAPVRVDTYEGLLKEYSEAKANSRAKIKAAKTAKERRELRAARPAMDFLGRFDALGKSGDVRGYFWMLDEARRLGIGKKDREAHMLDVYGLIVMAPTESKHFLPALDRLSEEGNLKPAQRVSLLKRVLGRKEIASEARCTAQLHTGGLLLKSEVDSDQAMGKQLLKELIANDTCGKLAKEAEAVLAGISLEVGGIAPNFTGTTIDGESFDLYDYRGKVVLVDFFGFW